MAKYKKQKSLALPRTKMIWNEMKKDSANTEMTEILELSDKNLKTAMINDVGNKSKRKKLNPLTVYSPLTSP